MHNIILNENGFSAHLSNIGRNIQGPVGRRIREGQWNATGLVIKEHEPDQANAAAKICNVDRFNHAHYTSAGCSGSQKGLCDGHTIGIDAVWLHCCRQVLHNYLHVRCLSEATWICLQFANGPSSCGRILKVEKGGDLFLFEACGTDIQNIETSNGVLIDWPGNLAVGGGYEVDYEKLKSSVSRLKGEEGRVFGDVLRRICYIPILHDPPVPRILHHTPGTPLGELRFHPNAVCEPLRDIFRRSTGPSYFVRARIGNVGCPRAQDCSCSRCRQLQEDSS